MKENTAKVVALVQLVKALAHSAPAHSRQIDAPLAYVVLRRRSA